MDLFLINRYKDPGEDIDLIHEETTRLEKLKEKIEERKKAFIKKEVPAVIHIKDVPVEAASNNIITDNKKEKENEPELNEITKSQNSKSKEEAAIEFKVLGASDFEKRTKVARILPYWLSHSLSISTDLQNVSCLVEEQTWLHNTLKSNLLNEGIKHLFPVQSQVIPFVLNEHRKPKVFRPHDICVSAPTGSGKTLTFVLPIIQLLINEVGCHIRALVVLPVQELAAQVANVFKKYSTKTHLKVALLSGSVPLHQEQQKIVKYTESSGWISEVDIIVCTAGRLVEHIQNTDGFSLKYLKFLVIDEADRIMDHIQNDWLYHVERHIKLENELMAGKAPVLNWCNLNEHIKPPHKLLFSATLSQDPEKLEQWGLFQPKLFSTAVTGDYEDDDQIRQYSTPAELRENFVVCNAENKPLVLYHLLVEQKWDKVICFTNAGDAAHRLTVLLNIWGKENLTVAELSANLDRSTRETVIKKFTQSKINVLIGTDALARGIDIPDCNYVVSYDPPRNIKTYIHRVGRTGRAGKIGQAVTILLPNQTGFFKDLLVKGRKSVIPEIRIPQDVFDRLSMSYESAIQKTKEQIHVEINSKVQKSIQIKRHKTRPQKRKHDMA
ncbi:probable ATP-dependent RNA helicase Dbp73D isoform X1 [Manduca sexta]|uniref:probable ATP-dependent RNA helicase Dbp73D isoform X1 n=1 Tax=Manduca sexta TaxID=7130 RepID=UPI00189055D6|nr:probable ATP-dependent RNA helicase Dbp73D isoform X1 [Manduca sexta]